jgi:hypothetical protein
MVNPPRPFCRALTQRWPLVSPIGYLSLESREAAAAVAIALEAWIYDNLP